ncbi:RecE family exodeoxyribonuclease [Hafnia alvei]|uniref:RecE family exodeoxyribonuclease n=2 Tax=Hafnia alvei TaxID=569 RepID=UPI00187D52B7|nr:RecE family exodeoxyribonuclease [Hafnia alvei]
MTIYFNFLSAKKSSDAKDAVVLVDVETAKECPFAISFLAKQNGIDLSNYFKPVTTDTPIVDDLPEENEFSTEWCEKYELADDKKTWQLIAPPEVETKIDDELIKVSAKPLDFRFTALWLHGDEIETITREQMSAVVAMIMDTDDNFYQNILLSVRSEQYAKDATLTQLGALVKATKEVFAYTDRPAQLGTISNFFKQYCSCAVSEAGQDALANIVKLYRDKQTTPVMPETKAQTTSTGATLGTPIRLSDDVLHSPVFLKKVIVYAMQPANGYDLLAPPKSIVDRAAELMKDKDVIDWYNALSETPGILALHPDFTFACIQAAPIAITSDKKKLREYISHNLGVIQPVPVKTEETASNEGAKPEVVTGELVNLGGSKFDVSQIFENKPPAINDAHLGENADLSTKHLGESEDLSTNVALSPRALQIKVALQSVINGETDLDSAEAIATTLESENVDPAYLLEWLPNEIELAELGDELEDCTVGSLMMDLFDIAPKFITDSSERVQFFTNQIALYKKEWAEIEAEKVSKEKPAKPKKPTIEELQVEIQALKTHQQLFSNFVSAGVKFLMACEGDK